MRWSKRLFDIFASLIGLLILSVPLLVVALLVKLSDGGPALYKQQRIGWRGRPFTMLKFRSMRVDADKIGPLITYGTDPRVTPIGRWLRKTKADEFPQLLNVLRGDMSLVGPRPEVPKYVAMYTPEQREVLNLVPGITDPASLKYRNESELLASAPDPLAMYVTDVMPDKIRINLEYAKDATLWTDINLIVKTILAAFFPGWDSVLRNGAVDASKSEARPGSGTPARD